MAIVLFLNESVSERFDCVIICAIDLRGKRECIEDEKKITSSADKGSIEEQVLLW